MYDIVVVGAGPTGLLLSACLARRGYKIKHIDIRPQATTTAGRADGIRPRSLDLLCNMCLKAEIMAQGAWVISRRCFLGSGSFRLWYKPDRIVGLAVQNRFAHLQLHCTKDSLRMS